MADTPETSDFMKEQQKRANILQKEFKLGTLELIQLLVGKPSPGEDQDHNPSLPKAVRLVEKPGTDMIEVGVGGSIGNYNASMTLKEAPGKKTIQVKVGATNTITMEDPPGKIELAVGQNKITIDNSGITIEGLKIQLKGQVQVQVQGPIVQVNGDGMIKMQGGIVMIN